MFEGLQNTISSQRAVNVGTSSGTFIEAIPQRVVLIISAPPTNRVTLSLENTAFDGQGLVLYPTNDPVILTYAQHGDLVTRAWTAIADTGAQTVAVFETFRK